MAYPEASSMELTGLGSMFPYLNTVTYGLFSGLLIFAIYVIILFGYKKVSGEWFGGFIVAGFITLILSGIGFFGQIVPLSIFTTTIGVFIVSLLVGMIAMYVR